MAPSGNPFEWNPSELDKVAVATAAEQQPEKSTETVTKSPHRRPFRPELIEEMEAMPVISDSGLLSGLTAEFLQAARQAETNLVMLSSARPGEGKTVNAVSIAHGLAREAGLRTLLVDLNVDHAQLGHLLGAGAKPGMTEVLFGESRIRETIFRSGPLGFDFMPFGRPIGGRLQLFNGPMGERLMELLVRLARAYDHVVLDGPAIFGSSDPAIMASRLGGVVMVIECEKTRWEVVSSAEKRLREAGGKPLGAILNRRRYHVPAFVYGK